MSMWRSWALAGVLLALVGCKPAGPDPVPAETSTPCGVLSWGGFPRFHPAQPDTHFRCHEAMALEHHPRSRSALWVAERVVGSAVDESIVTRDDNFRPDPTLPPAARAELVDYKGTGWDRGHLAPAADFKESVKGMSQSFYLSNIVPQAAAHNRGIWASLERQVRVWAQQRGVVHVWTGPIYAEGTPLAWIGKKVNKRSPGRVAVPTHLYKVIVDPQRFEAIAFVIPNQEGLASDAWGAYYVPLEHVELWTGLTWFGTLTPEQQQIVRAQQEPQRWF